MKIHVLNARAPKISSAFLKLSARDFEMRARAQLWARVTSLPKLTKTCFFWGGNKIWACFISYSICFSFVESFTSMAFRNKSAASKCQVDKNHFYFLYLLFLVLFEEVAVLLVNCERGWDFMRRTWFHFFYDQTLSFLLSWYWRPLFEDFSVEDMMLVGWRLKSLNQSQTDACLLFKKYASLMHFEKVKMNKFAIQFFQNLIKKDE